MKKWLISELGQGKYKMHIEHLLEIENKVLKEYWGHAKWTQGTVQRDDMNILINNNSDGFHPTE